MGICGKHSGRGEKSSLRQGMHEPLIWVHCDDHHDEYAPGHDDYVPGHLAAGTREILGSAVKMCGLHHRAMHSQTLLDGHALMITPSCVKLVLVSRRTFAHAEVCARLCITEICTTHATMQFECTL